MLYFLQLGLKLGLITTQSKSKKKKNNNNNLTIIVCLNETYMI